MVVVHTVEWLAIYLHFVLNCNVHSHGVPQNLRQAVEIANNIMQANGLLKMELPSTSVNAK